MSDNFDPSKGGIKLDNGKPRMELLPPDVLMQVAAVFTYGAKKYGARNWEKGGRWGRWMGSALRHCFAWVAGEENDAESGMPHLAHALCSLMMLFGMTLRKVGEDDRLPLVRLDDRDAA